MSEKQYRNTGAEELRENPVVVLETAKLLRTAGYPQFSCQWKYSVTKPFGGPHESSDLMRGGWVLEGAETFDAPNAKELRATLAKAIGESAVQAFATPSVEELAAAYLRAKASKIADDLVRLGVPLPEGIREDFAKAKALLDSSKAAFKALG